MEMPKNNDEDYESDRQTSLSPEQQKQIVDKLTKWGLNATNKDEPVLSFVDGSVITPRDIAVAMQDPESELRSHILDLIEVSVEAGDDIEEILDDFTV